MRIISGLLKSRIIKSPRGHRTHPMSEKARGAIFNSLGDLSGLSVLDAFAGSGALSIEAVSRGAVKAVAIDRDKRAYTTLKENVVSLELEEQIQVTRANAATWAKNNDELFDIVMLDPPYDDINPLHIYSLAEKVKPGGLLVLSIPDHFKPRLEDNFELLSTKKHGSLNLEIYRAA